MFDREFAREMKEKYPVGARIVCDFCADPICPIESGAQGVVSQVDDMGTVHVDWDSGRRFGLIAGEDSFHILKDER